MRKTTVQKLREDIHSHTHRFLVGYLYNHRKEKESLVSAHNMLINQLDRLIAKWAKGELKLIEDQNDA